MQGNHFRKIALALAALCLAPAAGSAQSEHAVKFSKALDYVQTYYVDSTDQAELVEQAIISLLKELDPHSVYISPEDVDAMNQPLLGSFDGIGVEFSIIDDTILVVSPISGGPSEAAGIRPGDRIVGINGQTVAGVGIKNTDVRDKLLGTKGTQVSLQVRRRGAEQNLEFTVERDKIPIHSLDAAYMVAPGIGYVKLNRFSANTMPEFHDAFAKLKALGMESLILDLQGNGGGYLHTAIDLADEFLPKDKLIVYTEGESSPRRDNLATARGNFETGRLVVLIDEGSASASEIVTGSIQDWDRGVVIGRRSFGKGLVQRPFTLPDGSMIRLTTARYYTPTGRSIQKPYDEGVDAYRDDLANRLEKGELLYLDSIKLPDSLRYETLVNGRLVYGGGGILPDIFVPIDTLYMTDYYKSLNRKSVLFTFALRHVDAQREAILQEFPTFEDFEGKFVVSDEMMRRLVDYAETNEGIQADEADFELSQNAIKNRLKAYMADDLWGDEFFFRVANSINPVFLEAVKVLQEEAIYIGALAE